MLSTKNQSMIADNLSVDADGVLTFAGRKTTLLRETYGTPLYLMDEARIRQNCRMYLSAVREAFGSGAKVLYASKAASFRAIYRIMKEEGMGIDVVSSGEIYTAHSAGYPMEKAYFHSNNKTDADILYAMEAGVGCLVADGEDELYAVERLAAKRGHRQDVLLRLTPGIDPHTYAAVATGKVDSKFGSAIETGQAEEVTRLALSLPHVHLRGYHCHVGSQVFDADIFCRTASVMLRFAAKMERECGFVAEELDIGGGYGVRYVESQPTVDIASSIRELGRYVRSEAEALGITLPTILMEPGRSIVADAGMTLYTVGTVKTIPGYKNYVSVDGGMTDNPRFALYGSPYTILPADNMYAERDFVASVVGRCCESGDILQENVPLPAGIHRGDLLATLTTGAYHYSMSSHYNRIPRPPVVMLTETSEYLAVRRETLEDVASCDL